MFAQLSDGSFLDIATIKILDAPDPEGSRTHTYARLVDGTMRHLDAEDYARVLEAVSKSCVESK